jgi:F0F1-type ATP synthase membrane subunit c/vacuolar-type H+-ATPase subunit K
MGTPPTDAESRAGRNFGVGCLMSVVGAFSGGMTGVLVAKAFDFFMRAPACPDIPSCHWGQFFMGGALVGAISLPALVLRRLRRTDGGGDNSNRG